MGLKSCQKLDVRRPKVGCLSLIERLMLIDEMEVRFVMIVIKVFKVIWFLL